MKKIIISTVIMLSCIMSGCKDTNISTSDTSIVPIKQTSTESLPDFTLNTDNILFSVSLNYMYDAIDENLYSIMCVRTDGEVYSVLCDISEENNFCQNLYQCKGELNFDKKNIAHIGTITDEELDTLIKYTENINLDSDFTAGYDSDAIPDVEPSFSYSFCAYKWDSDEKRKSFCIESIADMLGTEYITHDENALNALELVQNTDSYKNWNLMSSSDLCKSYFCAEVLEIYEKSALVKCEGLSSGDKAVISTVTDEGKSFEINVGDTIQVAYNGQVAETYPLQIHTIYDIIVFSKAK